MPKPREVRPLAERVDFAGVQWTLQSTGGGCTCYEAPALDRESGEIVGVWVATQKDSPDAPAVGDWAEVRLMSDAWDESKPNVSLYIRWLYPQRPPMPGEPRRTLHIVRGDHG